jgi:uncharacterized repeat protein (TIGR03803 family)
VIAFLTASMSLCAVRAKRCTAYKPVFWASLSQAPSLPTLLLLSMPLKRMAIFGPLGALYGTTIRGGAAGNGTVFKLTPPNARQTQWTESILYSFQGGSDGAAPYVGRSLFGPLGALYGTTYRGGSAGNGTVFKLTPTLRETQWIETVLYSFQGGNDATTSQTSLIFGPFGAPCMARRLAEGLLTRARFSS